MIYDTVGNHSLRELRRALNPNGAAIMIGGGGPSAGGLLGPVLCP